MPHTHSFANYWYTLATAAARSVCMPCSHPNLAAKTIALHMSNGVFLYLPSSHSGFCSSRDSSVHIHGINSLTSGQNIPS